jgi:hypothetical protein
MATEGGRGGSLRYRRTSLLDPDQFSALFICCWSAVWTEFRGLLVAGGFFCLFCLFVLRIVHQNYRVNVGSFVFLEDGDGVCEMMNGCTFNRWKRDEGCCSDDDAERRRKR